MIGPSFRHRRVVSTADALGSAFPQGQARLRTASATIEFAVVAPVFFVLVLGMVEVGRGLMVQHLMLNAARQGCRAGILPGNGNTQISTAVADTLSPASITTQSVSVTVNGASVDASTANSGDDLNVTITVPIAAVTWVPVSSFLSGNVSAQYTLRKQ